jgi:hypothetical protein
MRITVLFYMLLIPTIAAAEVSDKIPSMGFILGQGVVFAAVALVLSWFRWWFAFLGVGVGVLMLSGIWDMWQESYMRTAILNEQGPQYFVVAVVGALLVLGGAFGGVVLGKRKTPNQALHRTPKRLPPFRRR